MNYTVKYRTSSGSVREEIIEAMSRGEAFSLLKARGIVPISFSEGGISCSSTGKNHGRGAGSLWFRVSFLLVVLAALCTCIYFFLKGEQNQGVDTIRKVAFTNIIKKVSYPTKITIQKETISNTVKANKSVPPTIQTPSPEEHSIVTNDAELVIETTIKNGITNIVTQNLRRQTFTEPTDQLIVAILNGTVNDELPPLPPLGPEVEAQFKDALLRPIPDLPDDTDEIKEIKQAVRETRLEMKRLLDQGNTVKNILEEHRNLWNENVKTRDQVKDEYWKIRAEGDEEGARKYFTAMNAALEQMGIAPISDQRKKSKKKRKEAE